MSSLVGRIVDAITSDPDLIRDIGDVILDRNADPIEDLGNLANGAEEATRVLLSGTASAIAAADMNELDWTQRRTSVTAQYELQLTRHHVKSSILVTPFLSPLLPIAISPLKLVENFTGFDARR